MSRIRSAAGFALILALYMGVASPVHAGSVVYTFDNDVIGGHDRYYTGGHNLLWYGDEREGRGALDGLVDLVPGYPEGGERRLSLGLGRMLFTPEDIKVVDPPEDDRPYAAWAYLSTGFVVRAQQRVGALGLTLGRVGPDARGEQFQSDLHELIDDNAPRGWDTQLANEDAVLFQYTQRYIGRLDLGERWGVELNPGLSLWAGNVLTAAEAELGLRLGRNLPRDYGGPLFHTASSPEAHFQPSGGGWYLHARAVKRLVAHNIFLDGNTHTESRSTEKEPEVTQHSVGLAYHWSRVRLSLTRHVTSPEFKAQEEPHVHGSLQIAWAY